jgi:hypothetical protein
MICLKISRILREKIPRFATCALCLQAVLESGIPIDRIGGVSIGAFMGALWCQERDIGQVHFSSWFVEHIYVDIQYMVLLEGFVSRDKYFF